MEYEYFLWLVDFIDPDHVVERSYQPILYKLFKRDYTVPLKFSDDENRAADGLELRREFIDDGLSGELGDVHEAFMDRNCSCLEMLIALARRAECEIMHCPGEENIPKMFWFFLDNLGIGPSEEMVFSDGFVDDRLNLWLKRVPISRGGVSIFPDFTSKKNGKVMTVWEQMKIFINDNEDF